MKKLIMICIAIATLQVSAQKSENPNRKQWQETKTPYSPEEMAQLKAKKMTLKLALNEKQQKDVTSLYLEQAKTRKAKKESRLAAKDKSEKPAWSKEDRLKFANAKLDQQIIEQRKMKTILTEQQFEKWSKISDKRSHVTKRFDNNYKRRSNRMHSLKTRK